MILFAVKGSMDYDREIKTIDDWCPQFLVVLLLNAVRRLLLGAASIFDVERKRVRVISDYIQSEIWWRSIQLNNRESSRPWAVPAHFLVLLEIQEFRSSSWNSELCRRSTNKCGQEPIADEDEGGSLIELEEFLAYLWADTSKVNHVRFILGILSYEGRNDHQQWTDRMKTLTRST